MMCRIEVYGSEEQQLVLIPVVVYWYIRLTKCLHNLLIFVKNERKSMAVWSCFFVYFCFFR